jgi:hypothetical protein
MITAENNFSHQYDLYGNVVTSFGASADETSTEVESNLGVTSPTSLLSVSTVDVVDPATIQSGKVGGILESSNFIHNSSGWQIKPDGTAEFGSGYFRGDITGATGTFSGTVNVGSLNIPNTTEPNSFHTDTDGNSWWGCNVSDFNDDNDNAKSYILNTGTARFRNIIIGSDTNYFSFDGTNAVVTAARYLEIFTAGEDIATGDPLCLGRGCAKNTYDDGVLASRSAGVNSADPDVNYQGQTLQVYDKASGSHRWILIDFDFSSFSENFFSAQVSFYATSSGVNAAGPFRVYIYPITSQWNKNTVTYNTVPTIRSSIGYFEVNNSDGGIFYHATITNFMVGYKTGTACYGFMLKGAQSNFDTGYTNIPTETSSDFPYLGGRRLVYADKVFRSKSSIISGVTQEYRCFNFIGFAMNDAFTGDSIKVITQGVTGNQSGLIAGEDYYIGDSAGTIDRLTTISGNKPLYKIGKAVSSTELMIEKGEKIYDVNISGQNASPFYIPLYFRPLEIQVFTSATGFWSFGRYNNQKQYAIADGSGSITDNKLCSFYTSPFSMTNILSGGIVLDNFPNKASAIFTFKG